MPGIIYVLYTHNCFRNTISLEILSLLHKLFVCASIATFQVQAVELDFDPDTFHLSVVCINALGVNNSCDVGVIDAQTETAVCQVIAITSKVYSCQLPKRSETLLFVLAYDEGYDAEPAVMEMFVTPKLNYAQTDS